MAQTRRHKVFISYFHEDDEEWKERFLQMMGDLIVDRSVNIGDFADNRPPTEETLRQIREQHVSDATVTVVLIGPRTWQRKYVDWEINATLRDTRMNPRCGLLGILLPSHPNYNQSSYNPRLLPPRLAVNCTGADQYAKIYDWRGAQSVDSIQDWIHLAFNRRKRQPDPDTSLAPFPRNRTGDPARGWQN